MIKQVSLELGLAGRRMVSLYIILEGMFPGVGDFYKHRQQTALLLESLMLTKMTMLHLSAIIIFKIQIL